MASDTALIVTAAGRRVGRLGNRSTAVDLVREALRWAILNGELPGGTRIGLSEVADALEVSTTPVREALRELATEGLVKLDAYRGGTVHVLRREDMEEIVHLRQVLEPIAIQEAIEGMTPELLARAASIAEQMQHEPDYASWVDLNLSFHLTVYEAAKSRRLISIIRTLQNPTLMYVSSFLKDHPVMQARAMDEHSRLLDAIRAGEVESAIELTLQHLMIPLQENG